MPSFKLFMFSYLRSFVITTNICDEGLNRASYHSNLYISDVDSDRVKKAFNQKLMLTK